MQSKLVIFIVLIWTQLLYASPSPKSNCDQKINHSYYKICYDKNHKQAKWTFHELTSESINGTARRRNNYRRDPHVVEPVLRDDYKGSGYDRGHLVPAGDMKLNTQAMSETFYMTNMSPQKPDLNRRIWNQLENAIRKMVKSNGSAWIVTAPILKGNLSRLNSGVSIPQYYYKIAYFPKKQLMKAYLLENRLYQKVPLSTLQVSVDYIEKLTGIDMFESLEDSLEERLEQEIR